jgi:glycopeptide antibiotics resistance protein
LVGNYSDGLKRHALVNLVGNVIMFVPLGFFAAKLWEGFRPLWRCLLWGGLIIVCVELIQLFALVGSCDFDDLMLNVLGIGLGYGLYRWVQGRKNKG